MFYIVFVDVEPMTGNNVFRDTKGTDLGRVGGERIVKALTQPHLQRRWSNRDYQVNDQLDLTHNVSTKEVKQRCVKHNVIRQRTTV